MADLTAIKDGLRKLGATVSPDFDAKMLDPAFAENVRKTLEKHGASVPDSASFSKKYAPATRPTPQKTGSPAVDFFLSGRRDVGRPSRDSDVGVVEAMFPRASKAFYDDPRYLGGLPRRAAGGVLDVASLPGRVASAVLAPSDTSRTFAEQVANTGSPDDVSTARRVAHEIVVDPANAFLAGEVPLVGRALTALTKYAPKALSGTSAAAKTARSVGRGVNNIGLPIATVTAASDFAEGSEIGDALLEGLKTGVVASSVGPATDATRVVSKAIAKSWPVRPTVEWIGGLRNPTYLDPGAAVDVAKAEGKPLSYTGVRTAQTLGEAARNLANSDVAQFMQAPALNTAKKLLREQVKPAPAAKKGMEVEDFIESLNTPGMFDELTRYRDIFGGVGGFGKRNLDRIEEMNSKTWNPLFSRYEELRGRYNDALKFTDNWTNSELRGLYEYLGSEVPKDMAKRIGGVPSADVEARATKLADETIRSRAFGGDPKKLARALRDQIRIYSTPENASIYNLDQPLGELPISLAHRAKSQQFQNAYASGIPDDMTSARQYAANLVGKAHNQVIDDLINVIEQRTAKAEVLPSLMIRPNREEAEFAQNLFEGNDPVTEAMRDFAQQRTEGPVYDMQRKYFETGELPSSQEVTGAVLNDAANSNLLESRRANFVANAADAEYKRRVQQTADELEMDYNEMREITNKKRRPGIPPMPMKPREAFEREARAKFETDDLDRYTAEIMEEANRRTDARTKAFIDDLRKRGVEPWLAKWQPYREAQQGVAQALARTRKLDAALQPWYKAEAALQRAANTGGNRYSLKPTDLLLPLVGSGVGAGIDKLQGNDGVVDGVAIGALAGATPLGIARLLRTPAGPKLLRDVGRVIDDSKTGLLRNTGTTGMSTALDAILSEIPIDWADRLRTRKYNDAPVDSTTEGRLAEKKGDRK